MLDASALQQVKSYLDRLVNPITLTFAGDASEASEQIRSLLSDLASVSKLITVADAPADLQVRRPLLSRALAKTWASVLLHYLWDTNSRP